VYAHFIIWHAEKLLRGFGSSKIMYFVTRWGLIYNRQELCQADREYEAECIERDYNNERLLIVREFEEKKIELRLSLINELEEKKKQIEMERFSMELMSDPSEVKPMSTRKLRRRPNEPAPMPEKRRKTPQSQITFLLDDKDIDDDVKLIAKKKIIEGALGSYKKSEYLFS
jgi:hypothetical protein